MSSLLKLVWAIEMLNVKWVMQMIQKTEAKRHPALEHSAHAHSQRARAFLEQGTRDRETKGTSKTKRKRREPLPLYFLLPHDMSHEFAHVKAKWLSA